MAEGLSVAEANALLSAQVQGVSHVHTSAWAQLHVGPPGAAMTANIAVNDTRVDVSACFGTDPVGGLITNDGEMGPFPSPPADETYTHFTLHTEEVAGVPFISGTITAAAVTTGDPPWPVPIGDATLSYATAS